MCSGSTNLQILSEPIFDCLDENVFVMTIKTQAYHMLAFELTEGPLTTSTYLTRIPDN